MTGDPWPPRAPDRDDGELTPTASPARWERAVGSIVRAAAPELRRRAAPGVTGLIGRWARPLVAAAAALIVAASVALLSAGDGPAPDGDAVAGTERAPAVADLRRGRAPGLETAVYPAPMGSWVEGGEQPTVEEIVFSASVGPDGP